VRYQKFKNLSDFKRNLCFTFYKNPIRPSKAKNSRKFFEEGKVLKSILSALKLLKIFSSLKIIFKNYGKNV